MRSTKSLGTHFIQKSKTTWIKLGDINTRYFYSVIKHKRFHEVITQLKDEHDDWQTGLESITQVFVTYYE